jgi:hypothetical protein
MHSERNHDMADETATGAGEFHPLRQSNLDEAGLGPALLPLAGTGRSRSGFARSFRLHRRLGKVLSAWRVSAERAADYRYLLWAAALERRQRTGSPPDCRLLDARIGELAEEYPEYSDLDRRQAEKDADSWMNWPSHEPPVNWEGSHTPHTQYQKDHYWDGKYPSLRYLDQADPSRPGFSRLPGPRQDREPDWEMDMDVF